VNAAPITRRLAAILAADVVGYSRLMAADETGALARLSAALRSSGTCHSYVSSTRDG